MNQITIETNAIETETSELQAFVTKQMQEAVIELNSCQLALVGGGGGAIIL
jgi:hypothetical protein